MPGKVPFALLGEDAECPRSFWSFDFAGTEGRIRIGIIASDHGVRASWTASADRRILAIGHDAAVSFVDVAKCAILSVRPLDGVFYQFIPGEWRDYAIVLHEVGAMKFDFRGNCDLSVTTDIVEGWDLRNDRTLVLRQNGSEKELVVDVSRGLTIEE